MWMFLTRKVFNSDNFSTASCKQNMRISLLPVKLNKQKHGDLIHTID